MDAGPELGAVWSLGNPSASTKFYVCWFFVPMKGYVQNATLRTCIFLRPTDNGYTPLQKHQGNASNWFNKMQRTLHQTVRIKAKETNCQ
jgi:hypothetical protein